MSILVRKAARCALTFADGLLAVALAPPCASCQRPLHSPTASIVCDTCWDSIQPLQGPSCPVCSEPVRSWRREQVETRCESCRMRRTHIAAGRAMSVYDGVLRSLLHAFKYDGRRSLAEPLGTLMRQHGAPVLTGADAVVPVPLHLLRRWRRGFNQSELLSRHLGLPVRQSLVRRRYTRPQTDLAADERQQNVRGAFRVSRRARLRGCILVLVDDVSTTGATLEACARVLVEAGAAEVRTLTAARAVTRQPVAPRG